MRRTLTRLRLARLSGGVLTILLGLAAPLTAQTGSAPDASRLARFVPAEKLELYAEFSGLDAHKEAWQKTAAYRMLNETTLGAMLEEVGAQLAEAGMAQRPDRRLTGAEVVTIVKHLARHGFVFAGNDHTDAPKTTCAVLVIAKGARKDVRPIFSRLMLAAGGPNSKPELGKRGGRAIVLMKGSKPASQWAWWAEGEDLVVALDRPESVDIIGEVIDKKRPNALEDPTRAELAKTEDGFEPVALAFVGGAIWTDPKLAGPLQKAEVRGIERLDYRWGFHDDALMNVTRIVAPTPHQGLLALLDQPKFDAKTLPPLPDGL